MVIAYKGKFMKNIAVCKWWTGGHLLGDSVARGHPWHHSLGSPGLHN